MAECPCIHDDARTDGLDTDKTSPTKLSKVEPSKITPPVKYDSTADSGQNFLLSEVSHFQLDKTGGQAELASMTMPALILGLPVSIIDTANHKRLTQQSPLQAAST